jgi:hypothetical protein
MFSFQNQYLLYIIWFEYLSICIYFGFSPLRTSLDKVTYTVFFLAVV